MDLQSQLSRRERQIMDIVYAHGEASISDVLKELPNPPARGAMGRMVRILEAKGYGSIEQARGVLSLRNCPEPAAFERANYMKVLQSWKPDPTGRLHF